METRLLEMSGNVVLQHVENVRRRPRTTTAFVAAEDEEDFMVVGSRPRAASTQQLRPLPSPRPILQSNLPRFYQRMLTPFIPQPSRASDAAGAGGGTGSDHELQLVMSSSIEARAQMSAMKRNLQRVLVATSRPVLATIVEETPRQSTSAARACYVREALQHPLIESLRSGRLFAETPTAAAGAMAGSLRHCLVPLCIPPTGGDAALARYEFMRCMNGADPNTFVPFLPGLLTMATGVLAAGFFGVAIRVVPSKVTSDDLEADAVAAYVGGQLARPARAASSAPGCLVSGLDRAAARSLLPVRRSARDSSAELPPVAGALFPSEAYACVTDDVTKPRRLRVAPQVPALVLKVNHRRPPNHALSFNQYGANPRPSVSDMFNPYASPLQTLRLPTQHLQQAMLRVGSVLDEAYDSTGKDSYVLDVTTIFLHAHVDHGAVVCESVVDTTPRVVPLSTSIPLGVGGLALCVQRAASKGCGTPSVAAAMDAVEPISMCFSVPVLYGCAPSELQREKSFVTIASLYDLTATLRKRARMKNAAAPWFDNDLSAANISSAASAPTWTAMAARGTVEEPLKTFAAHADAVGMPASSLTHADIETFLYTQAGTGPDRLPAQRSLLLNQLRSRGVQVLPSTSRLKGVLDVTYSQGAVLGLYLRGRVLRVTAAECAVSFQQMERLGMRHTDALVSNVLLTLWPANCERALCAGTDLRAPSMPLTLGSRAGDASPPTDDGGACWSGDDDAGAGAGAGAASGTAASEARATAAEVSLRTVLVDYGTAAGVAGPIAMHGEDNKMIDQLLFSRFPAPAWTEDMIMFLAGVAYRGIYEASTVLSVPGALDEAADALHAAAGELRGDAAAAAAAVGGVDDTVRKLRGASRGMRAAAASGLGVSTVAPAPFTRAVEAMRQLRQTAEKVVLPAASTVSPQVVQRLCRSSRFEWPHVSANDGIPTLTTAQGFPLVCRLARDVHNEAKSLSNLTPDMPHALATSVGRVSAKVQDLLKSYTELLGERNGLTMLWGQRSHGTVRSLREAVLQISAKLAGMFREAGLVGDLMLNWSALATTYFNPFVDFSAPFSNKRLVDHVSVAAIAALLYSRYPEHIHYSRQCLQSMQDLLASCGAGEVDAVILRVLLVSSALRMQLISLAGAATQSKNVRRLQQYLVQRRDADREGVRARIYAVVCRAAAAVHDFMAGPMLPLDELQSTCKVVANAITETAPSYAGAGSHFEAEQHALHEASSRMASELRSNGEVVLAASEALGRAMRVLVETSARMGAAADHARRILAHAAGLAEAPADCRVESLHDSPWIALVRFVRTARATAVSSRVRYDVLGADPLFELCREYACVETMLQNVLIGTRRGAELQPWAEAGGAETHAEAGAGAAAAAAAVEQTGVAVSDVATKRMVDMLGLMHALPSVRGRSCVSAVFARSMAQASGARQTVKFVPGEAPRRRAVSFDGTTSLTLMLAECIAEKRREVPAASGLEFAREELDIVHRILESGLGGVAVNEGAAPGAACCPVASADVNSCAGWAAGETLDALLNTVLHARMMRTSPPPSWKELETLTNATRPLCEMKDIVKRDRSLEGLHRMTRSLSRSLPAITGDALAEAVICFTSRLIRLIATLPPARLTPTLVLASLPAAGGGGAGSGRLSDVPCAPSLSVLDFCRSAAFRSLQGRGTHEGCSVEHGNFPLSDPKITVASTVVQRARAAARALVDVGLAFCATVSGTGRSGICSSATSTSRKRRADVREPDQAENLYRASLHTGPLCGVTGRRRYTLCTSAARSRATSQAWEWRTASVSDSSFYAYNSSRVRMGGGTRLGAHVDHCVPLVLDFTLSKGPLRLDAWAAGAHEGARAGQVCSADIEAELERCCGKEDRTIRVWCVVQGPPRPPSCPLDPLPRVGRDFVGGSRQPTSTFSIRTRGTAQDELVPVWSHGAFVQTPALASEVGTGSGGAALSASVPPPSHSGSGDGGSRMLTAQGRWQGAYNYVCFLENLDMVARGGSKGYLRWSDAKASGELVSAQTLPSPLPPDVVEMGTHETVAAVVCWLTRAANRALMIEALAPFARLPMHIARAMRSLHVAGDRLDVWAREITDRCVQIASRVAERALALQTQPRRPVGVSHHAIASVVLYCMGSAADVPKDGIDMRDRWTSAQDDVQRLKKCISDNHETASSLQNLLHTAFQDLGCARDVRSAVEEAKLATEHALRLGETAGSATLTSSAFGSASEESVRAAADLVRREAVGCASVARAQNLVDMELAAHATEPGVMQVYALLKGSAVAGVAQDSSSASAPADTTSAFQSPLPGRSGSGAGRAAGDDCRFEVQPSDASVAGAGAAAGGGIVPSRPLTSCSAWRDHVEPQIRRAVVSALSNVSERMEVVAKRRRAARMRSPADQTAAPEPVSAVEDEDDVFSEEDLWRAFEQACSTVEETAPVSDLRRRLQEQLDAAVPKGLSVRMSLAERET